MDKSDEISVFNEFIFEAAHLFDSMIEGGVQSSVVCLIC